MAHHVETSKSPKGETRKRRLKRPIGSETSNTPISRASGNYLVPGFRNPAMNRWAKLMAYLGGHMAGGFFSNSAGGEFGSLDCYRPAFLLAREMGQR